MIDSVSHPEFRNRKEIAARMGVAPATLAKWIKAANDAGAGIKPAAIVAHYGHNVYLYDPATVIDIEALRKGHYPRGLWPRNTRRQK